MGACTCRGRASHVSPARQAAHLGAAAEARALCCGLQAATSLTSRYLPRACLLLLLLWAAEVGPHERLSATDGTGSGLESCNFLLGLLCLVQTLTILVPHPEATSTYYYLICLLSLLITVQKKAPFIWFATLRTSMRIQILNLKQK